jgi:DNA-binding transcriptional ArsR family regulator
MASKRKNGKSRRPPPKKLRQVIDPVLARALAHPLRSHILMTLGDRVASPSEIAKELGMNARDLSYHFGILAEIGMIKLVRTEKRRGALEHFYGLDLPLGLIYLDDEEWRRIPEAVRSSFGISHLQVVLDEAVDALRAGTFNARDNHNSRVPMIVDEEGRTEVLKLMDETLERMLQIRQACSQRRAKGTRDGMPMEVFMIGFETAAGAT